MIDYSYCRYSCYCDICFEKISDDYVNLEDLKEYISKSDIRTIIDNGEEIHICEECQEYK